MENTEKLNTATEGELEQVAGGSGEYLKNECRICGAVFRSGKELKQHLRGAHPGDPRVPALLKKIK